MAKIQWDNDKIRVQLRQINADGSPGSYANYWFDSQNPSFPVGTMFAWEMTVVNGVLYVTVDGETVVHDFTLSLPRSGTRDFARSSFVSDYSDDEFYFSAGSQPQDNTQDNQTGPVEAGEILFHSFYVNHEPLEPLAVSALDMQSEQVSQVAPTLLFIVIGALLSTSLVVRAYRKVG